MSGRPAVAGTHVFVVPDRERAQALVTALAGYGFARVLARPGPGDGWHVTALDEGPYPPGTDGQRAIDTAGREAAVLARRHDGRPDGGLRCDPDMLRLLPAQAPIVATGSGVRPPVPVPAPPAAPMALTPDAVRTTPADLTALDAVDWSRLEHAHGPADDVPDLIRALAAGTGEWADTLDELYGDDLLHQGTCYSATAPGLAVLAGLVGSFAAPQRLDLLLCLLYAAGQWGAGLLDDAEPAAAQRRLPQAGPWTQEVHQAIGGELPALLARWPEEPPATRYVLACLAAVYPDHGRPLAREIGVLAREFDGTRPGAFLRLAEALVCGDDERALAIAAEIAAWAEDVDPGWLGVPGTSPATRCLRVLTGGALSMSG
ncbi:hypothetical protein [Amycolatopsis sp. 195334CR]|uniref:hypothetical protein n=1 Tax=Amycolatopsis sp. 195334CR TaxID=2814588 RepID=UPI001A8E4871|nr:hypothetical protein [Amycolatopsis sp. 195334CR]MBN6042345.1 hypothetical protein [Amycolatopsis sp. 195334CR]